MRLTGSVGISTTRPFAASLIIPCKVTRTGSVANRMLQAGRVTRNRPPLFRGRHFEDVVIILCVRWYLRYSLSYRDLKEIMAERGLSVDHVTIWRWVQHYAPILNQQIRRELRHPNRSWRVDETYGALSSA